LERGGAESAEGCSDKNSAYSATLRFYNQNTGSWGLPEVVDDPMQTVHQLSIAAPRCCVAEPERRRVLSVRASYSIWLVSER